MQAAQVLRFQIRLAPAAAPAYIRGGHIPVLSSQGDAVYQHKSVSRVLVTVLISLSVVACAAATRFESPGPGSTLEIVGRPGSVLPRQEKLSSKATGQHEFKAAAPDGAVMYGILPLRVNGGKMAVSIMFFAPALLIGGFRDVFPYYEIDPVARVIRYRSSSSEEWRIYTPTSAKMERAERAFATSGS